MSYLKNSKLSTVNTNSNRILWLTLPSPLISRNYCVHSNVCISNGSNSSCRIVGCTSLSFQLSGKCAGIQRPTRVCQFAELHIQGDGTLMRSGHHKNTHGFDQVEINAVAKSMKSFTMVWKDRRKSHTLLFWTQSWTLSRAGVKLTKCKCT